MTWEWLPRRLANFLFGAGNRCQSWWELDALFHYHIYCLIFSRSYTANARNSTDIFYIELFEQTLYRCLTQVFDFVFNSLRPSDAYMRQKLSIIGSDNDLCPGRRQAIILTNAGILEIEEQTAAKSIHFHTRNAFENVLCELAVILSRPQCVNSPCALF